MNICHSVMIRRRIGGWFRGRGGTLDSKLANKSFERSVETDSGNDLKTLSAFGGLRFLKRF